MATTNVNDLSYLTIDDFTDGDSFLIVDDQKLRRLTKQTLYKDIELKVKGQKGDRGATGVKGDTGEKGEKGDKGDRGETGFGEKGETGSRGEAGTRGWSPLVRIEKLEEGDFPYLYDWTGGEGEKPSTVGYITRYGISPSIDYSSSIKGGQGIQGVQGDRGASGSNGESIYDIAKRTGYTGTEAEFLKTLVGKNNYELAVVAGYSGTLEEWLLELTHKSSYELAIENGFEGDLQEWLISLAGYDGWSPVLATEITDDACYIKITGWTGGEGERPPIDVYLSEEGFSEDINEATNLKGNKGNDGRSAYQVAVDNGYVGTEEEWLTTLLDEVKNDFAEEMDEFVKKVDTISSDQIIDENGKNQQEINDNLTQQSKTNTDEISENKDKINNHAILIDKHDVDINVIRKLATTPSHASIKHYRKNGLIYDVITGILPWQLSLQSNRENTSSLASKAMTLREMAEKYGKPVAVNCAGFRNADGTTGWEKDLLVTNGVHIENGVVVSGWEANPASTQACCLMKDGKLKRFNKSEATAQQMVDQGAVWGQSWGGSWKIENGVPLYTTNPSPPVAELSARTIIFQLPDDTIGFVLVEGNSGSYGATTEQAADIALALGAVSAYSLDGGGSSQAYWGDTYAMASADATSRKVPACFLVSVASVLPYKSGIVEHPLNPLLGTTPYSSIYPALFFEQVGNEVTLSLNISDSKLTHDASITVSSVRLPARYRSDATIFARTLCLGAGARMFKFYQGGNAGSFSVETVNLDPTATPPTPPPTSLWGALSWRLNQK